MKYVSLSIVGLFLTAGAFANPNQEIQCFSDLEITSENTLSRFYGEGVMIIPTTLQAYEALVGIEDLAQQSGLENQYCFRGKYSRNGSQFFAQNLVATSR